MKIFQGVSIAVLLAVASPAIAGETILFEQIPAWVEPIDLNKTIAEEESPESIFVIVDRQVKLEGGLNYNYSDLAIRATSNEVIPVIASIIKGVWQPDQGDLIIHRLEVLRDGEIIKPLENGLKFDTLRREAKLEQQQLNGMLTATTQLEDIQLGDIVRFFRINHKSKPGISWPRGIFRNDNKAGIDHIDQSIARDLAKIGKDSMEYVG